MTAWRVSKTKSTRFITSFCKNKPMGLMDGNCLESGIETFIENIEWIVGAKHGKEEATKS